MEKQWIPIKTLIGGAMPYDAAEIVLLARDEMLRRGDITDKALWRMLELLAADYLSQTGYEK